MDSGEGRFVTADSIETLEGMESQYPDHGGKFTEGEIIEIRGSWFRVQKIAPKKLILKLLKKATAEKINSRTTPEEGDE